MRYVRLGQTDLKVSALAFGRALGPPPRRHLSAQERSAVIRTTINDHEGSAT
jgi:hypothetical protein